MTDSDLELSLQQLAKNALQQQKQLKAEREAETDRRIRMLQLKMEKSSLPQSTLKLRPTNQSTQEQQRLLTRDALLQLSKNLRNTNLSNPYALKFQIKGPVLDEELEKKLRAAIRNMQQRKTINKRYFEHQAADHQYEEQHHRRYSFER